MVRHTLTILTAAIIAVSSTSAQLCTVPVKEALAPCICWENALRIFCHEETDLKAVFERVSPMIDDSVVFDQLHIGYHPIAEIPANIFGSLKAREINIYGTTPIEFIHPDAFNASYEHTRIFIANRLRSYEDNHDIFRLINRFRNLEELDIHANDIRYIPDDPFPQPMPNLKKVRTGGNKVEFLGTGFFKNLPALERTDFGSLELNLDMLSPATFEGIGPNVELHLEWNDFPTLPQEIFSPVLNNAKAVYVGGATCYFFCSYEQLDCDERINWICEDVGLYQPKLDGYYCKPGAGAGVAHIWQYCDSLNKTTNH